MFHRHPFLSLATFAYLGFVGWLTLTPRPLGEQTDILARVINGLHRRGYVESLTFERAEFLANIALFVPVGVFLLLLFGAGGWWLAAIGSFAITSGIEWLQRSIPGRVPDERDIAANTLGALVGIVLALVLTLPATIRRVKRKRAARPA